MREQRQLSYQLFAASTDQEMLLACLVKGGMDLREQYQGYELIASRLITALAADEKPSVDLVDASLVAHKDLRHLYDQFGRSDRGSFDVVYRPLVDGRPILNDVPTNCIVSKRCNQSVVR